MNTIHHFGNGPLDSPQRRTQTTIAERSRSFVKRTIGRSPRISFVAMIVFCMLTAPGCSFLLKAGDPDFSEEWQGCYRGGEPRTGLILEAVLDDDGETTRMLTGCLVLGLGTPNPQMATVSGVADSDEEIEVSDGTALYQLTRDDQGTDTRIDDTVTVLHPDR